MKQGVSLLIVVIGVSIMLILVSTASVIGSRSIITANFEEFKSTVARVADEVNQYYVENETLPVKIETINAESYPDFYNYLVENGNDAGAKFYVVDLDKLNDLTIEKGRGQTESRDVFVVSDISQNVYYLAGFKYNKVMYFGI